MRLVMFRGRWHAYERINGQPKRTSLGTADRAVAERRLRDLEAAQRRKATTVAEMYQDYLADRGPQISSQETLRLAWGRLQPIFGHLRPDQITRALTRAYAAKETRRRVGSASIRRDLGVLGAVVRYNDKNSPAVIEMPAAPSPRTLYLTRDQYQALREAAKSVPHLNVFIVVAYSTAGRASAVLALRWDQVDFTRRQIALGSGERRVKGRATVPMTGACHAILAETRHSSISDYVVEYAGRQVRSVKRAFKAAVARAGLDPRVSPHVLRHSAAVHMAESGVPMSEIAQFLGHSSETVTYRVYARFSPDHLRRAAGALE
jgi:integrase